MSSTFAYPETLKLVVLLFIMTCVGCDQIFEEDLTGKCVSIIAPSDSLHTSTSSIQFDWEDLDGASGYRLQIARPGFEDIEQLIFDSLISGTTATVSLYPGIFQWRLRAENASSESEYTLRNIAIDSTMDLSQQEIILIGPTDNHATNQTIVQFSWYALYNAEQYSFLLKHDDWNGSLAIPEVIITVNNLEIENLEEGLYSWGVRGESSLSNTPYSANSLWVDFTSPGLSILNSPANNATVSDDYSLTWTRPSDTGSGLSDSLFIYSDAELTTAVLVVKTNTSTYSPSLDNGTYYWRVKCIDDAGNSGDYSTSRSFSVQ